MYLCRVYGNFIFLKESDSDTRAIKKQRHTRPLKICVNFSC